MKLQKNKTIKGALVATLVSIGVVTFAPAAQGVSALDVCAPECDYSTTTVITPSTPDPSPAGTPFTLNGTVEVADPGATFPSQATLQGEVAVSDGVDSCTDSTLDVTSTPTVFAFSCDLAPTSAGAKTYTATYSDTSSVATIDTSSDTESHQVFVQAAIVLTSSLYDVNGDGVTTLSASISPSGDCANLVPLSMTVTPSTGAPVVANPTTNEAGVASTTVSLPRGMYSVTVEASDTSTCHYTPTSASLAVLWLASSSTGGGSYTIESTPSRAHFAYTVRVIGRGSNPRLSGRILWMNNRKNKLSGSITGFQVPVACPTVASLEFTKCAKLIGTARLCDDDIATGTWVDPRTVTFEAWVGDGGKIRSNGKKSPQGRFDAFGISISGEIVAGESSPLQLRGGNLQIR